MNSKKNLVMCGGSLIFNHLVVNWAICENFSQWRPSLETKCPNFVHMVDLATLHSLGWDVFCGNVEVLVLSKNLSINLDTIILDN